MDINFKFLTKLLRYDIPKLINEQEKGIKRVTATKLTCGTTHDKPGKQC